LVIIAACDRVFRRRDSTAARAAWASRWLRRCLRVANVRISATGPRPTGRILIANHLSYLDSAVLATLQPVVFVARHDLQHVPIFGRLIRHAGTIFIDRQRKRDLLNVIAALPAVAQAGALPAFFPEGATTSGAALLPFRSSLFAPAVAHRWPVTPVHLRYMLEPGDGGVENDVCWWGGTPFFPHFINLLAKRCVHVRVTLGETIAPGADRKALARELQRRVEALGRERSLPAHDRRRPARFHARSLLS
jgi:1-acyl-sn-glycerol-3-phosphate acyltransferase